MNKISNQHFNLNAKLNDLSKAEDVLGALFSIPLTVDNKNFEEVTIKPDYGLILKNVYNTEKKSKIVNEGLNNFHKPKELINVNLKKNEQISHQTISTLTLKVKVEVNKNLNNKINTKIMSNKQIGEINLKQKKLDNNLINTKDNVSKLTDKISKNNKSLNNLKQENPINSLKNIFDKIEHFKEENITENLNDKLLPISNEIKYGKFKLNSENSLNVSNHFNKIEMVNSSNNSSNQNNFFASEKNINFVLDKLIEELDMTQLGWTEKLVMKFDKAFKEGKEEIELLLKPKELGTLKISLKVNDKNAQIILKAENNASMLALQANEGILTKSLLENGMVLEKISFENFQMGTQQNNNKSSKDQKSKQLDEINNSEISEENEIKDDNSNYIININA